MARIHHCKFSYLTTGPASSNPVTRWVAAFSALRRALFRMHGEFKFASRFQRLLDDLRFPARKFVPAAICVPWGDYRPTTPYQCQCKVNVQTPSMQLLVSNNKINRYYHITKWRSRLHLHISWCLITRRMYTHTITIRTSTISEQGDCLESISLFSEQIRAGATIRLCNAGAIIKLGKIFRSWIRVCMHVAEAIALVCMRESTQC